MCGPLVVVVLGGDLLVAIGFYLPADGRDASLSEVVVLARRPLARRLDKLERR
jgi:hypothetical protein